MDRSIYSEIMKQKDRQVLAGSLVYGLLFAILLYRNMNGIGVPVFMLVTCLFMTGFFRMFGIRIKKETVYYMIVMTLLGVSTVLTASGFFIMFNWMGSIFLFFLILIHQFYEDREWNFITYSGIYVRMMFAPFGNILSPFRTIIKFRNKKEYQEEKTGYIGQIFFGIMAAALILMFILPLLFSGDMVFASFIRLFAGNMKKFAVSADWFVLFLFGFVCCFAVWKAFTNFDPDIKYEEKEERTVQVSGITCILILTVVYMIFCLIQIGALFLGHGKELPEGITYSVYARSGFFELLGVSIVNIMIVMIVIHLFRPERVMRRILTLFSICTYIMIFSSAYRMVMYIQAYQLTLLRVLVLWGLCVLSFILAGVIVNVYKQDFPLFRYSASVCAMCYLILSLSRPDEWMAHYNLAHKEEIESYDEISYLFSKDFLSAVNLNLQKPTGNPENLISYCQEIIDSYENQPGWTYNIGEARAEKAAEEILSQYENIT